MLREYLPFWARLTEGQQRRLEEGAAVRRFARGEMVYGGCLLYTSDAADD